VDDVMTAEPVSVEPAASYRTLVDLLVGHRFSAVPVVDELRRVIGVVSEADLLRKVEYAGADTPRLFDSRRDRGGRAKARAATAGELMSVPPVVALAGTAIAAAARQMDREDVKRLPVVDDLGRLVGVVTRSDLLKVHLRSDDEIHEEVVDEVVRVFLSEDAGSIDVAVADGVVTLSGKVDRWSSTGLAVRLTKQVAGVVEVVDMLTFAYDDRAHSGSGTVFGVA
jgi:CBS domain-containing protein